MAGLILCEPPQSGNGKQETYPAGTEFTVFKQICNFIPGHLVFVGIFQDLGISLPNFDYY